MEKLAKAKNDDQIAEEQRQKELLQASIRLAVEMESMFKLYAYRIVDQQTYVEEIQKNVEAFNDVNQKNLF